MDKNYDVITFISKHLYLKKTRKPLKTQEKLKELETMH